MYYEARERALSNGRCYHLAAILRRKGRVVRVGKSVAFLEGELKDKNGKILASGTQTAKLRRNFYK